MNILIFSEVRCQESLLDAAYSMQTARADCLITCLIQKERKKEREREVRGQFPTTVVAEDPTPPSSECPSGPGAAWSAVLAADSECGGTGSCLVSGCISGATPDASIATCTIIVRLKASLGNIRAYIAIFIPQIVNPSRVWYVRMPFFNCEGSFLSDHYKSAYFGPILLWGLEPCQLVQMEAK